MLAVRFKGNDYLLIADSIDGDGAIATREQYENGLCSYAHLCADGLIRRFNNVIGAKGDIEVIGPTDAEPNEDAIFNLFFDPDWKGQ